MTNPSLHSSTEPLLRLLMTLKLLPEVPPAGLFEEAVEGPLRTLGRKGMLREVDALKAIAKYLNLPFYDLDCPDMLARCVAEDYIRDLDPNLLWAQKIVPLFEQKGYVHVACANPFQREAAKLLEFTLSKPVQLVLAEERLIARLLMDLCPTAGAAYDELEFVGAESVEFLPAPGSEADREDRSDLPPVIRLCNHIVSQAISEGASDIHLEPLARYVQVRFRVDGIMRNVLEVPRRLQHHLVSRFKVMAGMDIAERRRPQDGRIRVKSGEEPIDLRVSSVPLTTGEKLVLRVLRADVAALTFQRLGLPKEIEPRVIHALHAQGKLLLTTGPTGSGKTTTLYTCLNYLRDGTNNIETVEDPVEFRIPGISQIQVNEAIDVTFASALRSVLRQDPDVIMVGEIRDEETADIALQAAQTGHLVLSSLHTNDAPSAVARLVNLGVDTYSIATGLAGVLAQRLVRRVCERCRVADDTIPPEILEKLKAALGPETSFLRGTGCAACRHTGFKGRVGLFSYLQITEALAELIHQKASMATLIDEAKRDGYRDLEEGAFDLLERGITSWAEVADYIAFADEPAPQPPLPAQDAPEGTRALKRIKVLLIDDDPDMRAVFSLVLSREAYEVIEAENGLDGLNKLYQHTPDLVLCDLMMPVMDGREFLLKIRGNADTRTIPVVMLTAANSEANEISLLDLGARDFLGKQSSPSVIATRLRRVLTGS